MKRGLTGYYIPIPSAAGENARAFVPNPLPPLPALELDAEIQELVEKAMLALGRLDGLTTVLPDPRLPCSFHPHPIRCWNVWARWKNSCTTTPSRRRS